VTVGICWSNGKTDTVKMFAGRTGSIRLRTTLFDGVFSLTDEISGASVPIDGSGELRSFQALAGHTYLLRNGAVASMRLVRPSHAGACEANL